MKRKLGALTLVLALLLTPALAASEDPAQVPMLLSAGEEPVPTAYSPRAAAPAVTQLPTVNTYPGFDDVPHDAWYFQGVKTCYEAGLMMGTDKGYQPELTMSVAQTAAIAARLREAIAGEPIPMATPKPGETLPWYFSYINYLTDLMADSGIRFSEEKALLERPEEPVTRLGYFLLLNVAFTGQDFLSPINSITALPDTDNESVLAFYNAGILTGTDEYGTFAGDRTLTRAECAVMAARLADPNLRMAFTLVEKAPDPSGQGTSSGQGASSVTPPAPQQTAAPVQTQPPAAQDDVTVMTVNGKEIPRNTFIQYLNELIYILDSQLYQQSHTRLDWSAQYDLGDLRTFFLNQAVERTIRYAILDEKCAQYDCTIDDMPAKLTGDPGHDALSTFAQENDFLCATHILVGTPEEAKAVLDGLSAVPTLDQFKALQIVFNTDPGMEQNPDGYLFTSGVMLSQFEEGTRSLAVGTYSSEPVVSPVGYHIIWRLDPANHPQLLFQYQYDKFLDQLDLWASQAKVTVDENAVYSIDPRACYEALYQ